MKRINEMFYSLQGEGRNAGRPAIFIRFAGCNLKCPFCDTHHQEGDVITEEDIITFCNRFPAKLVVLTGGEPTLFVDSLLIKMLHDAGKEIAIETNGTNAPAWLKDVDFVTVSPKFEFIKTAKYIPFFKADELKVVYDGNNNLELYKNYDVKYRYLQPCDTGNAEKNAEILKATIDYCKEHPDWNISLQTQKILNIR